MKKILLLAATIFCFLNLANAQPGELDPSFGTNGIVKTDLGDSYKAGSAAVKQILPQPDGTFYVLQDFLTKRLANGSIDSSFGINGFAPGAGSYPDKMAIEPDGKIVVSANFRGLARYNTDGSVDSSFSDNGKLIKSNYGELAIQKDGKIILGGGGSVSRYNTDGSVDTTFSGDGTVITNSIYINSAAIQSDEKIVAGGYKDSDYEHIDFAVVRYNINGSLDSTFSGDGIQTTDFGSIDDILTVAIQSDGKIVVTGFSGGDFAIARYNIDGSLDKSFSADGKQTAKLPTYDVSIAFQTNGKIVVASGNTIFRYNTDGSMESIIFQTNNIINSIAIQNDGKILIGGDHNSYLFLARSNSDGSLDNTFIGNGKFTDTARAANTGYKSIAIQADGKAVAVGSKWNGSNFDFAIVRYNSDGSPDNTFSNDDIQTTDFASVNNEAKSVAIQKNGKIIVAGGYYIARYNTDGSLDSTFSDNGKQTTDSFSIRAIAIQGDGKIVAAGGKNSKDKYGFDSSYPVVSRYNVNGSVDKTFGVNGKQTISLDYNESSSISSIAIQKDGKILTAGIIIEESNPYPGFVILTRLNTDGSIDSAFGRSGAFSPSGTGTSCSVVVQNDGKILLAQSGSPHDLARTEVFRYNVDGSADTSFNAFEMGRYYENPQNTSLALQNDGKIVVLGLDLVRLNTNGRLDSTFNINAKQRVDFDIQDIAISNNKLYLAGGDRYGTLARYSLDGANTPPTVSITTPTNNAIFGAGAYIKINAAASDADGTNSKVEFYNGNTLLHTETVVPYGYQWKNVPAGSYTLTVKATDNSGLVTTSAPVHITVVPNIAPSVSITTPANNQTIAGPTTIRLMAAAKDPDGTITKVQFYNGTTLLRIETASPYSYTWEDVPVGNYAVTAKAADNWGVVTTSAVVNISVVPNKAPTVSITNPANEESFTAPATIPLIASAQDPDGTISRVEFYNGTTLLNIQYKSPYTHTMRDVPAGTYTITAKAIDNLGLAATSAPITVTVAGTNTIVSSRPALNNKAAVKDALSLKAWPNPATNMVNISAKGLPQNKQATITVISASGVIMKTTQSNSSTQTMQLDVSSLVKGMYTIKVTCGDKVMYKQFVKL